MFATDGRRFFNKTQGKSSSQPENANGHKARPGLSRMGNSKGSKSDDRHLGIEKESQNDGSKLILEQDRFLPIANISRLMKNVIPSTGKVAKDAKECIQECVSEFISFLTSEASERCTLEKRKTITGEDLLVALSNLGFDNYVDPLSTYMKKYREANRCDRGSDTYANESSAPLSLASSIVTKNTHENEIVASANVYTVATPTTAGSSGLSQSLSFVEEVNEEPSRTVNGINLSNLQFFMDPTTGLHYINVQGPNGTPQIWPVQFAQVASSASAEQSSNGAFDVSAGTHVEELSHDHNHLEIQQVVEMQQMEYSPHYSQINGRGPIRKRSHDNDCDSIEYFTFE